MKVFSMPSDKDILVKYRIERAEGTLEEIELAIENDKLHLAANRIYYSVFYVVSALALKNEFKTSKHSQLLSWFNREIVKTGLIDKNFGKFNQAKDFIGKVKEIIAG